MTDILKQVAGIDVAQNELVVSLGRIGRSLKAEVYARKAFANKPSGFKAMTSWVSRLASEQTPVSYVMEATGVYHQALAYYLDGENLSVSIVLPNKISNYSRALEVKTVTDKTAATAICYFGLERSPDTWEPPAKVFMLLKQLTRERDQLICDRTVVKNQLHAEQAEAFPNARSVDRMEKLIEFLNKQEKDVQKDITATIKQEPELSGKIKLLTTIPGIGILSAVIILAETNGFDLIRNKKQLVSYAGLDIKEKQSGTSVNGKPRISKRGNRHIRKALHMPSLAAIRSNERYKAIFVRLIGRHGIKMKAVVSIQRKLLEMTYIIWKAQKPYDKAYLEKHDKQPVTA